MLLAVESYSDAAQTTLASAITSNTQTSISVSSATGFPTAGQYRVIIDSELLLVTGGLGTTTWTVTRGAESTSAATHASGATVTQILTVGSLLALSGAPVNTNGAGLTGATAATRFAGGTTSGAPASGTFAVGDVVTDQTGALWVCTAAGSPGTWTKVGASTSSGLTLLEQHTASSSATLDFTTAITSTYDDYLIEVVDILPATSGAYLQLLCGTGGGPTWDTTSGHYMWEEGWYASGGSVNAHGSNSDAAILFGQSGIYNGSGVGGITLSLRLHGPAYSGYKVFFGNGGWWYSGDQSRMQHLAQSGGVYAQTTAVTGLRFLMSSGNIASGTIRVYGIAKS